MWEKKSSVYNQPIRNFWSYAFHLIHTFFVLIYAGHAIIDT